MKKRNVLLMMIVLCILMFGCNEEKNDGSNTGNDDVSEKDIVEKDMGYKEIEDQLLNINNAIGDVTIELVQSIESGMIYGELFQMLGVTKSEGQDVTYAIYQLDNGDKLKISYINLDDICKFDGYELLERSISLFDDEDAEEAYYKLQGFRITADVLNVRTENNTSSDIIGSVSEDEELRIFEIKADDEGRDWYLTRLKDEQMGWVASWYTRPVDIDISLGKFISMERTLEGNTRREYIGNIMVLPEEMHDLDARTISDGGFDYKTFISVSEDRASNLNFEYEDILDVNHGGREVFVPILINDDKVVFWIKGEDEGIFYLCRKDLKSNNLDIIYTYETINTYNLIEVLNYNMDLISYKINNEILIYDLYENELITHNLYSELSNSIALSADGKTIAFEEEMSIYLANIEMGNIKLVTKKYSDGEDDIDSIAARYPYFSPSNSDYLAYALVGYEWYVGVGGYMLSEGMHTFQGKNIVGRWVSPTYLQHSEIIYGEEELGIVQGLEDINMYYYTFTKDYYVYENLKFNNHQDIFLYNDAFELVRINPSNGSSRLVEGLGEMELIYSASEDGKWLITSGDKFRIYKLKD